MTTAMRPWCAIYQWPGKAKFLFSAAWVRAQAPHHEIETEFAAEFKRAWLDVLPDGVPLPELINYRPGQIVFVDSEHEGIAT